MNATIEAQAWNFGIIATVVAVVLPTLMQVAVSATPLLA
jgi:hypothetical protein